MAEKPAAKSGDMKLTSFNVRKAENGYKVCANYEKKNKTLSQKAGWVPSTLYDDKEYVYTDKKAAKEAIEKMIESL